jgi:hypothetical protein
MRHLLFHIYPLETPGGQKCLQWHLKQLQKSVALFDGQLIFAIVTGEGLLPPESVAKLLPSRAQILVRPNDPNFGESCTLPMLLAKAFTLEPSDVLFYAHSKGVTHVNKAQEAPTRWWSLSMYRWLFSEEALAKLATHSCAGWLKFDGPHDCFPPWSKWHYSGNFWWFRAADLYRQAWWLVPPTRFGAEAYPSTWASTEMAASLHSFPWRVLTRDDGLSHLYYRDFWEKLGIPQGPDADSYA